MRFDFITFVAGIYNFCRIIRNNREMQIIDILQIIKSAKKPHKTIICFVY